MDMFNTGGAVEEVEIHTASDNKQELFDGEVVSEHTTSLSPVTTATIALKVRGSGKFGVYSSQRPLKCTVDGAETDFNYESETGLTTFTIPVHQVEMYKWLIEIQV
jgi:raffinose synthase